LPPRFGEVVREKAQGQRGQQRRELLRKARGERN